MAFSFGNPSQSAFGTAAAKPTGFGTVFGAATTTAPTFGFGSTFGTTTQAPAFGSTFGAPATGTTAPSFGSTFGAPASSAAPTFGTGFGAASTSAAPGFGTSFGAQQQTGLFGAATSKPGFFSSTSTPSLFSTPASGTTNLFGGTTTQNTGLFGAGTTTTPSLFGTTTSTPSLFGQPAATTTTSLFGTTPAGSSGFGGLFGTTTSAPSLFGTNFGTTTTSASTGFGGFNTGNTFGGFGTAQATGNLFGQTGQQKQAVPVEISKNQQVVASIYAINVFNDERDEILKKWNMLQACWGTGKGFYNASQPPVEYTPQNQFYRFKAIGYNVIPEQDNSEGIVRLIFSKKISEMKNQQEVLKNGIAGILGNKPNLTIDIQQIRAISENRTEVKISVSEKGVTGTSRKIPASDLAAFLNQPMPKQQLTNVGVSSITAFVTPTKAELEEYLRQPPPGIDPQMWQAAIQDNPNPKKYIPVAINGFSELRSRMLHQEYQTGLHQAFLDKVNKDATEFNTKHAASMAQMSELKQKFLQLQHRILRVLVKQESIRKVGIAIQPEEEILRGRLETMNAHLNNPKQFKGQVNELLTNVKMMDNSQNQHNLKYRIDSEAQEEIKQILKMEQNGIVQLIDVINTDLQGLNIIKDGLKQHYENQGAVSVLYK